MELWVEQKKGLFLLMLYTLQMTLRIFYTIAVPVGRSINSTS